MLVVFFSLVNLSECFLVPEMRRVAEVSNWEEAERRLSRKKTGAVVIKSEMTTHQDTWDMVKPLDIKLNLNTADSDEVLSALAKKFECDKLPLESSFLQDVLEGYQRLTNTKEIRLRALVAEGRMMQPCPKLHTDNVFLRCLVPLAGAGTVVVDRPSFFFDDKLPDSAFYQTSPGDILLLKGRKWHHSTAAAYHRSPIPPITATDHHENASKKRAFLSIDRLEDVIL